MVDIKDKKIYFSRTFNEQMAWINEEVEHIIKYNEVRKIKKGIQDQGRDAYGEATYTHAINRLFEIIKADPKNKALLREVNRAEEELIAFLYDEPGALSEEDIIAYWNNYKWAYIAEIESQKIHYFLIREYEEFHDGDEWIGIYHAWDLARDAYYKAVEELEKEHQEDGNIYGNNASQHIKIMVNIYDETTGKWEYDVEPKLIFKKKISEDKENYKEIECVIDSVDLLQWKLDNIKKDLFGYCYDDSKGKSGRMNGVECISVRFKIEHTYQVFDLLDWYWGNYNECPDCNTMKKKAKEWQEKYGAELVRISHDSLTFKCHRLSVEEAEEIIVEAAKLYAEIIDCKTEKLVDYMMRENTFTLWWD